MSDLPTLRASTEKITLELRPLIDSVSDIKWLPEHGYLILVRTAVLRRQYDALNATIHLIDHDLGYAAVPLLRPACEELIWIGCLKAIPHDAAERLVQCLTLHETGQSLRVQDAYAGSDVTKSLGLSSYLEAARKREPQIQADLKELGERLKWHKRVIERSTLPSINFLAKETGNKELYDFLYHATSRFVHFSPVELIRRAWGKPGEISVRSTHFHDYWSAFSLRWGLRLFMDVLIELSGLWDKFEGLDGDAILAACEEISDFGQVPIITSEELAWPTS